MVYLQLASNQSMVQWLGQGIGNTGAKWCCYLVTVLTSPKLLFTGLEQHPQPPLWRRNSMSYELTWES